MIMVSRCARVAPFVLLAAVTSLPAQVPVQRIHQRTGTAPDGFSRATAALELADGRVLVTDVRDRTLVLVDFSTSSATPLSRQGSGPNEYQSIGPLVRGAGDTLFMVDFAPRRLLRITPTGQIAGTRTFEVSLTDTLRGERQPPGSGRVVGSPRFMDANGRLYYDLSYLDRAARQTMPDASIAMLDPASGRSRIVAPFMRWYPGHSSRWRAPFMTQDVWSVAPDGRVVRVIPAPYHVEWYRDGALLASGPAVLYVAVPVTADDRKEYWTERAMQRAGGSAQVVGPAPTPERAAERERDRSASSGGVTDADFPAAKPPFVEGYVGSTVRISPEGEAWVARTRAYRDSIPTIDVFDQSGRLVRQVVLPPRRTLLGFGRGVVFLLHTDDDGLQWLERFRR